MVILENSSVSIKKKDFYYHVTILTGHPSNKDWFEFVNFLKQLYTTHNIFSFAFIFDFSNIDSNSVSISSFLEIILFFKQNRVTTLKILVGTALIIKSQMLCNFINGVMAFYTPDRPFKFVKSMDEALLFLKNNLAEIEKKNLTNDLKRFFDLQYDKDTNESVGKLIDEDTDKHSANYIDKKMIKQTDKDSISDIKKCEKYNFFNDNEIDENFID